MAFASIPDRTNGERIIREWFNQLRDAGEALETGVTSSTTQVIANNQSSAANVTGAVLTSSEYTSGIITAQILRSSTMQMVRIFMYYNGSSWSTETIGDAGSDAGVTFSITAGGQLQYTSTNTSAGTMKWYFSTKFAA